MKIQTFQKIQKKLVEFTMLPVTLFIAIGIFFWQSIWQSHIILTTIAFIASVAACFYFLSINIIDKPWSYLIKMYQDNKKYKTLSKLKFDQEQVLKKQPNPQQTLSEKQLDLTRSQAYRKQSHIHPVHVAFNIESDKEIQQSPTQTHSPSRRQHARQVITSKIPQPKLSLFPSSIKTASDPNACDIMNLFHFTSQKSQPQKPQRKMRQSQRQQFDYINQFDEEEQSQKLRRHVQTIVGKQEDMEALYRKQYQERYLKYKKSLNDFLLDKEIMDRLVFEAKSVVKEKIQEHLRKQFQNLDSIESILKKNFDVNFKSYKERSSDASSSNIYGFNPVQGYAGIDSTFAPFQQKGLFNKKQTVGYQSLGKKLKFSTVLQQSVNLMHTNYFDFQFVGESGRINETKNELKVLIQERIQLDKYLYLRKPLDISKIQSITAEQPEQILSEFQEQRYLTILKLQTLVSILNQRQSAQQNLLKQFFSKHHTFSTQYNTPIDQINDERNIELLINFIVKIFRQKLTDSSNEDLIKIQLSRPNLSDPSANLVWVKKENSTRSHYDIIYSLKKEEKQQEKIQEKPIIKEASKSSVSHPQTIYCCPGQTNIWTCIAFVRLLISKIGLKKQEYPMIKDKQLKKDFRRLYQLLK